MKYVIFGPGRVGANIAAYLTTLGHTVSLISRRRVETGRDDCRRLIDEADVIAAAIDDASLSDWRAQWRNEIGRKPALHFSGAMTVAGMHGFHPLYSFPPTLLDPAIPPTIAFACPEKGPSFREVFPNADNPHFVISDKARAHYHALAVLSGNFAAHLWNETAKEFKAHYGEAPETILTSYFKSIVARFSECPENSLTGPAARRDRDSVAANLDALRDNPKLSALYLAFLRSAWPDYDAK